MKRKCDICNTDYYVKKSDLARGWGLTCSKSCAAKKRERSRNNYDETTVKINNLKRKLWFNKYRSIELELRKKNKNMTDIEIWVEMYKITNDEIFLFDEIKDIFIF